MFIELTRIDGRTIFVNPNNVSLIEPSTATDPDLKDATVLLLINGCSRQVKEQPREVVGLIRLGDYIIAEH